MVPNEVSAEVRRVIDRLALVPFGALVTVPDLQAATGLDLRRRRHLLYSALRVLQRESGAVFAGERGAGYRRLSAELAPGVIGSTARARIRGTARRGMRAIDATVKHANHLPPDAQRRANAERAALGLIEHIARDRPVMETAATASRPLSVAEAARGFLTGMGAKIA